LDEQSPAEHLLAARGANDEYKVAHDGAYFTPLECTGATDEQNDSQLDQKLEID